MPPCKSFRLTYPREASRLAQPDLTEDGLRLRPWRSDDVEAVVAAFTDPDIQRWHRRVLTTQDEALEWIAGWQHRWAAETGACWALCEELSGGVLGRVALTRLDLLEGTGAVGYWMLPHARGRGGATRAVRAVTQWSFDLGLHRLELGHSVRNPASCRVAQKSGYLVEGTLRSALRHADGWHDMHLHAAVNPGTGEPVSQLRSDRGQ